MQEALTINRAFQPKHFKFVTKGTKPSLGALVIWIIGQLGRSIPNCPGISIEGKSAPLLDNVDDNYFFSEPDGQHPDRLKRQLSLWPMVARRSGQKTGGGGVLPAEDGPCQPWAATGSYGGGLARMA